ncbi:MAG: N-acetylmuramoyl-L-alanine amidase family 2 [Thermomicrobiales bacterium]|nr:N-acetylmuramoyl-L-alanine amidase family 2 [Thermomicrobiales bacterium]
MRREASGGWPSSGRVSRLGRRSVLRAGAGVAAGLLVGAEQRQAQAVPVRQSGSLTLGGRWVEAEGFRLAQRGDPAQFIAFTADFPFYALAPSWSGEGDPGGSVELLWSADGVTWSEPIWIGRASHNGRPDRDGRIIGSLVSTPGATFLQYRTYDSAGNFAPLPGFEIDYIDATAGPSLEQIANPALTPVFSPPPLITRAAWGADESLRFGKGGEERFPVEYQPVEHVIIHHADTANFNDPVLEMRSIYYFHAVTRGWGDIAYNYLVDAATPEMHNAIVWISSWAARSLDPTGGAPFHDIGNLPTICGHRDVNNTTCPGDEFYMQLDTVRTEARRVIRGRDDPEPPPPQWHPGMRVLTNAEGASLRTGPGIDFDVATKVAFGEPLLVLQGPTTNDSTIWYEVQGVSLTGWVAGNLLTPDPDPVPLDPLPTETPVTVAPPDTATPVPIGEGAPPVEEPISEAEPVEAPVENGETGDVQDGGDTEDTEQLQETWPVFAAGTATIVASGPLNLHVEPALWAAVVTALPAGYMATVIAGPVEGEGIAWYQVSTPEGVEGWCDGSYLQTL